MPERQKTPFGVWIAIALIVLLVGYPLSIGPVAYVVNEVGGDQNLPQWCRSGLLALYSPILWAINSGPLWLSRPGGAYMEWWMQPQGV